MVDARTARTQSAVCKVIGAVVAVGLALTCAGTASADAGRAGAPITYASAKPSPRAAQPMPAGPIDLRPGAVPVSFGPAPAASRTGDVIPMALLNAPSRTASNARPETPPQASAQTKPYAGPPYEVDGKWYVPTYEPNYDEVGVASWYGPTFHGEKSASGEVFDEMAITAAHPTLPIPSLVRVTNLENGKSIIARLNDRGPFVDDRIIDLSRGTAEALDMRVKGTAKVRVQYVGPAPVAPNTVPPGETQFASAPPTMMAQNSFGLSTEALPPLVAAEPVIEYRSAAPQPRVQDQSGIYLQAGSFSDLGNAHKHRDRMLSHGPAFVTSAQVNGSVFYRVMVGPWPSQAAAEQVQDNIRFAGSKTLLVAHLDR